MLAGISGVQIVLVTLLCRVGMDKPPEESMEVGTQSQSQMDTSNSQAVSDQTGKGDTEKTAEPEQTRFPTTLEGFKYMFNKEGQLRHIETGEAFVFKVKDDQKYNQQHYEALGEVVTTHVYNLLEKETNLKRVHVPTDASEGEPQSFVFMSEDALTNPDRLMLLIHGSGVVRAGQWARRLIINDCLDSGTQLPFIKKAVQDGYGIIVLNTNENTARIGDVTKPVRENDSPVEHGLYVWKHFVSRAKAEHVAIIAHSYGGVVTVELAQEMINEFKKRVFAIALTDSVHSLVHQEVAPPVSKFFSKVSRNWVSSKEALDTPVPSRYKQECPQVAAGTNKHEETSWSSFDSIFTFLNERYNSVTEQKKEEL